MIARSGIRFINFKTTLLLALFLTSLLSACKPSENEAFIQGTWFYNDMHIQKQFGESFSETYWNFDRGAYETSTCCFVKFEQFGRYNIVESQGDKLVLELFNIDGKFNSERYQIAITIDRQADTIRLTHGGPYTRVVP